MNRCDCGGREPFLVRSFSRRATLQVAAGTVAATVHAAGFARQPAAAQDATPMAGDLPDLAGVAPLPLTGERRAAFSAYVSAKLAELGIPGAAIAVIHDGDVALLEGFGVREAGQTAPVTADTLLRIGSVTKSFSSLLAATLVDAGRLDWETPLADLLPDFAVADPELTPRLTVADAFCACTGLPRRDLEFQLRASDLTPELVIEGMARLPLTAPYGEAFQYNNQMVGAGGFAAAISDGGSVDDLGRAYAIVLRDRVLNPIGMERTTLSLAEVVSDGDYASPHTQGAAGAFRPLPLLEDDEWVVPVAPSGALWSSAREMARYVQTELARGVGPDGGRVVSAENLERTWQPGVALPASPETPPLFAALYGHYGLGWIVGAYGGQRLIRHSGELLGFTAQVFFLPEAGVGAVVLTNGSGDAHLFTLAVELRLLEVLFDQPETADARMTAAFAGAVATRAAHLARLGPVDPAAVSPFVGRYANADLGGLALALRDGSLTMRVGGFRSELRAVRDEDVPATAYVPVDPPFDSGLSPMTIGLRLGSDDRPEVTLTIADDDGIDLTYPFDLSADTARAP